MNESLSPVHLMAVQNYVCQKGETAFMTAIRSKQNDLLEKLINLGAKVDHCNKVWSDTFGEISVWGFTLKLDL